jgi:SNF2 family DNA or RNA helicase
VLVVDQQRKLQYVNPAAENLLDASRKALLRQTLDELFPDDDELFDLCEQALAHKFADLRQELTLVRPGREALHVHTIVSALDDGNLLLELRENDHRALVFSQYVDFLELVRQRLDEAGVTYQYLDGSTPRAQRTARVNAFQAGEGTLFLISLKAGGFGLNLTAADYVIHLDPWWNPAVEAQATDRAHRIGQDRPVTVYRLITKDTIEESIVALHENKRALADALLSEGSEAATLSASELIGLIEREPSF